jgi:hypothetical protein
MILWFLYPELSALVLTYRPWIVKLIDISYLFCLHVSFVRLRFVHVIGSFVSCIIRFLLIMFSLKTINKIVQSGNITHPLTLHICGYVHLNASNGYIFWLCLWIVNAQFILFLSCIVRSYFVSCVRLIKLTNETSDTRNERTNYTNEAQTNKNNIKICFNIFLC